MGITLNLGELSTFIDIKISTITVFVFSVIAQVIIEKRAHRLVEGYVISCYNHPSRGDYNTEAPGAGQNTSQIFVYLCSNDI